MKTSVIVFATVVALLNFGCAGKPRGAAPASAARSTGAAYEPVVRLHFAGSDKLFAQPGTAKLKQIWELPGSIGLRNETLDRFARVPVHLLAADVAKNSPDQAALFRPLLEDILSRESYFELGAAPEFALAIRLPEDRARLWQTNLASAISNWKLADTGQFQFEQGWEAKTRGALKAIRFVRAGDWAILAAGSEKLAPFSNVLAAAKSVRRPAGWLEGIADLQQLQRWVSWLPNYDNLPTAHFSFSNRADAVRTEVQFEFARPHGWKPEPWHIPTNVLHDPLVSFTAAQGIAPLLNGMKVMRDIGWQPAFNQFIAFANETVGFQLNAVFPTTDATNQLKRVMPKIDSALRSANTNLLGRLVWGDARRDVIWHGLPVFPHLSTFRDASTEYLFATVFQPPPPDNPAPGELLSEIAGKKDVAYYDWELTQPRINHWLQLYQLAEIATRHALTPTNVPSEQFFAQASPLLGNAGTKITVTSPTQMSLLRNSDIGLTAFELVTLTRWLESTNFPAFGIFGTAPMPIRRAAK